MDRITPKNAVEEVAERLRNFMESNDLSYAEMSRRTGISDNQIKNIANGRIDNPGLITVLQLMEACFYPTYIAKKR